MYGIFEILAGFGVRKVRLMADQSFATIADAVAALPVACWEMDEDGADAADLITTTGLVLSVERI